MLYKSYKQLYRLVLNSKDATDKTTVIHVIDGQDTNIDTKYFFKLNIELPFTTQARLAVKSFYANILNHSGALNKPDAIGTVFSPTISQRNTYQSSGTTKGCLLLSHNFGSPSTYDNPDYTLNYIDIQNNTSWLTDGIVVHVDSKIIDDNTTEVGGFPDGDEWMLELIIYDAELEPNPAFKPFKPFENGYAPVYG